jgi:glycosyltransferase involved in cell wall biosynthesis
VLWIAGGAQRPHEVKYLARLERTIETLGLTPRVRFLGDRRDIPALMAASDLLVQANEGPEPFGIVFAEALLAGLPVVTTDMGGAPEIVDNTCGRLVTPDDVPALADCLAELIADSRLRARLAAAGRAHATIRCAPEAILPRLQRTLAAHRLTAAA